MQYEEVKLLIITQSVDSKNFVPLLFFVGWLKEFGKLCKSVEVIAQRVGEYELPANVHVHSLGKENGHPLWRQIIRAWMLLWSLRGEYDAVLVHMTPVWVLLGAPFCLLLRKPVYLWYEARGTRWNLRFALPLVRKVFSASQGGLPLSTKKRIITGHGIDVHFFSYGTEERDPHLIITLGRFTKAKRLDHIIRAFAKLRPECRLMNIGATITDEDQKTVSDIKVLVEGLCLTNRVQFRTVSDEELLTLLQRATLLLHASEGTSLDKAVLQAMACGCLVVSSSPVVKPHIPVICQATPDTLSDVAKTMLLLSPEGKQILRKELRDIVDREHSLPKLIKRLVQELNEG